MDSESQLNKFLIKGVTIPLSHILQHEQSVQDFDCFNTISNNLQEYPPRELPVIKIKLIKKQTFKPKYKRQKNVKDIFINKNGNLKIYEDKDYLNYKLNQYHEILKYCIKSYDPVTFEKVENCLQSPQTDQFNENYNQQFILHQNICIIQQHLTIALNKHFKITISNEILEKKLKYFFGCEQSQSLPINIAIQYILITEHFDIHSRYYALFVAQDIDYNEEITFQQLFYIIKQIDIGVSAQVLQNIMLQQNIQSEHISFVQYITILKELCVKI